MDVPNKLALYVTGFVAVATIGCVSPYPYNSPYGNGYGGQPGGYYGQPQYVPPSSVPSGGVQLNAPTPIDSGPPSSSGGSNSDAPLFPQDANKQVPDYRSPDPGDVSAPDNAEKDMFYDEEKTSFGTNKNPFGMKSTPSELKNLAYEESDVEPPPLETVVLEEPTEAPPPIALTGGPEYSTPLELKTDAASLKLPYDPATMPNPYDYDREGYRSLRGLVTFDDNTQTWIMMYNDKPEQDDEYGGVFTLADNDFSVLNDYDVVYLEGSVSETETDAFGKPMYKVDFLQKLQAPAN